MLAKGFGYLRVLEDSTDQAVLPIKGRSSPVFNLSFSSSPHQLHMLVQPPSPASHAGHAMAHTQGGVAQWQSNSASSLQRLTFLILAFFLTKYQLSSAKGEGAVGPGFDSQHPQQWAFGGLFQGV